MPLRLPPACSSNIPAMDVDVTLPNQAGGLLGRRKRRRKYERLRIDGQPRSRHEMRQQIACGSSSPTAKRIVVGGNAGFGQFARGRSSECVVSAGQLMIVFDWPRLIMWSNVGDRLSKNRWNASRGTP